MDERQSEGETLHERDFWSWTAEQAALLRDGRLAEVDVANLVEELEAMGRREVAELRSRLRVLALHLLKEIMQPRKASRSWAATIVNQRLELAQHLEDNPGLKPRVETIFATAYGDGRKLAAAETGLPLSDFPITAPFTTEQALDDAFCGNEKYPKRRRFESTTLESPGPGLGAWK